MNDRIKELNDYLTESKTFFDKVDRYKFIEDQKEPRFDYEPSTDRRVIYYNGTYGSMLNELKHAFQYENGDLDFVEGIDKGEIVMGGGFLYDRPDEDQTYERQYAFDGILKLRVKLKENQTDDVKVAELLGVNNVSEVITINKMSEITADIVVKIMDDDGTLLYNTISQKRLSTNSSIREVIKGNVNRPNLINKYGLKAIKKKNKVPYIDFIKVLKSERDIIYVKKN